MDPARLERAEERLRNPRPGGDIEAAQRFGVDLTLPIEKLRLFARRACSKDARGRGSCGVAARRRPQAAVMNFIAVVQKLLDAEVDFASIGG